MPAPAMIEAMDLVMQNALLWGFYHHTGALTQEPLLTCDYLRVAE